MQIETRSSLDARLIVFLNYQGLFLLFSKHSIDIYNSKLQRIHSYEQSIRESSFLFYVGFPKIQNMPTIHTIILHMSPPTKMYWFAITAIVYVLEK